MVFVLVLAARERECVVCVVVSGEYEDRGRWTRVFILF